MSRVFGIDPGTARLGYGILDEAPGRRGVAVVAFGVISTEPGDAGGRLHQLFDGLEALLEESRPDLAAVEQLFFGHNTTTALAVSQARGVALLALARAGVPVREVTPAEVKLAVAGWGRADKRQVQAMVARLLNLSEVPQPDDAADALAVAWSALGAWPAV